MCLLGNQSDAPLELVHHAVEFSFALKIISHCLIVKSFIFARRKSTSGEQKGRVTIDPAFFFSAD
jgi:hypothetical protein